MVRESDPLIGNPNAQLSGEKYELARDVVSNAYSRKAAVFVQAGLLILITSILYGIFTHPIIFWFAGHPIFNSLGLVFLAQALLVTQPAPLSGEHKTVGGQIHGVLNTTSVLMFLGGFSFIFYNKHSHGAEHITSWHAVFGITTYSLLAVALLVGVAQFWTPILVFGSIERAKSVYKYHRMAGYFILLLISCTILLALDSDYNNNVLHIPYWSVVPAVALVFGGLVSGLNVAKLGF